MQALLTLSDRFKEQVRVITDDPHFAFTHSKDFTEDGTIVNQSEIMRVCEGLAEQYDLCVDEGAAQRITELCAEPEFSTPSLHLPDGFVLKKFQRRCLNTLENRPLAMIQASCGTGKTIMSTAMMCREFDKGHIDRAVVWCPSTLIGDWVENIHQFTSLSVATVNVKRPPAKRQEFYEHTTAQVLVLNYERVRTADLKAIGSALRGKNLMFVMDEVTKVKGRTSAIHRNLAKLIKKLKVARRLALTATPIVVGPEDFYNEFRIIDPSAFGLVRDFEHEYTINDGERDYWNNYVGYQHIAEMRAKVGAEMFSADKTQPEIAAEFPQKQEILVPLDLTNEDSNVYQAIFDYGKELDPDLRCGTLFALTFTRLCNMPEVLLTMQHGGDKEYGKQSEAIWEICQNHIKDIAGSKNSQKLAMVTEKVDEIMGSGERVIVFAAHTHNCLYPLAEHLKKMNPLLYTGDMSQTEKDESSRKFKDGGQKLLLMSDAGQLGLNFPECANIIQYQTPVTHAAYEQRADRVHRLSSEADRVTIYRMLTRNTIEERIEDTMQGRKQMSQAMGFGGEYEEVGDISEADADWFCGF